jgi:hypothetical protein
MAYSKAKLKSNGDKAPPCLKPFYQTSLPLFKICSISKFLIFIYLLYMIYIYPPHWLSSKGTNYQCGVLLISAGATEGHFEGLVLARQCPGSPGTCNPEETGIPGLPLSWLPTLFSGSGPAGLPTCSLDWKKQLKRSPLFIRRGGHCCRGDLVGWTTFRFFFFEWLAKVRATC